MVTLKEFVSDAIVQISEGILDAREKTAGTSTIINPNVIRKDGIDNMAAMGPGNQCVSLLQFDVAVTAKRDTELRADGKAKAGFITVISGSIETSVSHDRVNENISRLRFTIPVRFPSSAG